MRINTSLLSISLLILGDVFWISAVKISQLGLLMLVWFIYRSNRFVSKKYFPYIILIFIYNVILNLFTDGDMINSIIKISLLMLILLCAFDMSEGLYNNILSYYEDLALFVVGVWWFQMLAFLVASISSLDLQFIYDSSAWSDAGKLHMAGSFPRLNAFFSEPSYLGLFVLPLFVLRFYQKQIFGALIILLPLIMTFSLTVYAGLGVFILLNVRWSYQAIFTIMAALILLVLFGLDKYIVHRLTTDTGYVDVTLLLYIFHIETYLTDWKNYLFGFGFDNYFLMFQNWRQNFIETDIITIAKTIQDEDLMLHSGPLMVLRLIVEFGLGFVFALVIGLRKYFMLKSYWIYSLLGLSLRDGDYLRPFFLFFVIMQISNVKHRKSRNNERSNAIHSLQS